MAEAHTADEDSLIYLGSACARDSFFSGSSFQVFMWDFFLGPGRHWLVGLWVGGCIFGTERKRGVEGVSEGARQLVRNQIFDCAVIRPASASRCKVGLLVFHWLLLSVACVTGWKCASLLGGFPRANVWEENACKKYKIMVKNTISESKLFQPGALLSLGGSPPYTPTPQLSSHSMLEFALMSYHWSPLPVPLPVYLRGFPLICISA